MISAVLQETPKGTAIKAQRVPLPWEPSHQQGLALVQPDVLSEKECNDIICSCEAAGFEQALLNVGGGRQVLASDIRQSGRCIVDDVQAATVLWERLRHIVPAERTVVHGGTLWQCVGLNERLRVLKYEPGDYFAPHSDGRFVRMQGSAPLAMGQPRDTSFLTCMLYLNTPLQGGDTNFLNPRDESQMSSVAPRTGMALVFDHDLTHEGALLKRGVKYCIRTDCMYRRAALPTVVSKLSQQIVGKWNETAKAEPTGSEVTDGGTTAT